jgi:hypothetical protein
MAAGRTRKVLFGLSEGNKGIDFILLNACGVLLHILKGMHSWRQ